MGLFGKLFEKKICDICGSEIGLLGNRKLEDGNCCKNCAAKLSPWFDERRHSTIEQIKDQLAYRERNARLLNDFRVSQVIGEDDKMYIEEVNGIPTRFFICDSDSYMDENPDIIEFKDVLSCVTDVREDETELKRKTEDGEEVSYNPPRYETEYDFYINMQIGNNPYFDDIRFKVNSRTVTIESRAGASGTFMGLTFTSTPVNVGNPRERERLNDYKAMCQQIEYTVQRSRMAPQVPVQQVPVQPEPEVSRPKFCQNCGAPAEGGKFCQNCGAKL